MTPNRSLELSSQIQNLMRGNILQFIQPIFPVEVLANYQAASSSQDSSKKYPQRRDRVYNSENTLLTMILTALHEDKSLQNSVNIIQQIFNKNIEKVIKYAEEQTEKEKEDDLRKQTKKKAGRPKLYKPRIPKSKLQPISSNTAAYSKARKRLDYGLIEEVFEKTKDFSDLTKNHKWNSREVFLTDGTYFQMQDTEELQEKYRVKTNKDDLPTGYPQGLLQVIIKQGIGSVYTYKIGSRHQSELELLLPLIEKIPAKSLLLADDLYNTYAIFSLLRQRDIDIIVPGKRKRNYKVIRRISDGDEIVEISRTARPAWLPKGYELPPKIILRRISYSDSENPKKKHILYTSILDESIKKIDIIIKYITRWDIEITIREVKTLMGINIARSKTEDMVFKEFMVVLIAYNLIRKVIVQSSGETAFSPKADIIQKYIEINKTALVDKKGRLYNKWSTGRIPKAGIAS
ncbi:MAG TPA: IS4 family transposase [Ignavibacteria bacterium]|nr:IS4 family transposase [Ignavibacteria bacterium]